MQQHLYLLFNVVFLCCVHLGVTFDINMSISHICPTVICTFGPFYVLQVTTVIYFNALHRYTDSVWKCAEQP